MSDLTLDKAMEILIHARKHRRTLKAKPVAYAVVFFILLVGNVGGALSPLGDPPLFIGYLKGVDFFWTTYHLAWPTFVITGALLIAFYVLDRWFQRHDPPARTLNLLSCGRRKAIASRGGLTAQGRWVWWWKDHVDRAFVARYSMGAAVEPVAVVAGAGPAPADAPTSVAPGAPIPPIPSAGTR